VRKHILRQPAQTNYCQEFNIEPLVNDPLAKGKAPVLCPVDKTSFSTPQNEHPLESTAQSDGEVIFKFIGGIVCKQMFDHLDQVLSVQTDLTMNIAAMKNTIKEIHMVH